MDRILLGGEQGWPGAQYAIAVGDPGRPSRRVLDGPHVELLERYRRVGEALRSDTELMGTGYVANALECIRVTGSYFGATDRAGVLAVAREVLDRADGADPDPRTGRSAPGDPIRMARIRWSDCYQLVDGNHRVAFAADRRATSVDAAVTRRSVTTPLQDLLLRMSWTVGRRELYQPVDAPEVSSWPVVRRCRDRLEMMLDGLTRLSVRASTYLDVGSGYGWFVVAMGERGYRARGVEQDPLGPRIGEIAYALEPERVTTAECAAFLASGARADLVSCFSVLHHFVLGNGSCSAEELLALLDRSTGCMLVLETGQAHEEWFADTLPEWDADHIEAWVLANSSFTRALRLGTDRDAVDSYAGNYGRTTFGFVR